MKKFSPFLAFASIVITLTLVLQTYAVFETDVETDTESSLAKWQIKVNGTNITGAYNTFTVPSVHWSSNSNVLPDRGSPGLSAYFEIIIDPNGSDVSIDYDISLDFAALNNDMIELVSVKDEAGNPLTETVPNTFSDIITLAQINSNYIEKIRVDFTWIDSEENNGVDSETVNQYNSFINIPVSIRLSQHFD